MPENPTRILLVDDDVVDRMAVERLVQDQELPYDLSAAASAKEALEKLESTDYDVVLLDYLLGDGTAMEVLPAIRKRGTPVVIITGSGNETVAVGAMKEGAWDYMIKDPDRNYLTVLPATVQNVLARKAAEEALHESQERLLAIVESQPDMIFETDVEGRVSFMSPACKELLGQTADQMVGRVIHEFCCPETAPATRDALAEIIRDRSELRFHHGTWRHADGSERTMSTNARPFLDRHGTAVGLRGSIRDITRYQQVLADLDRSRAQANRARLEAAAAREEVVRLQGHLGRNTDFEGLVGRHPSMAELYEKIRLAATTEVTVHINGASGSGKELVAHALHNLSPRSDKPFVVVNCSAIPDTLVESTLFGHRKGAYTGAVTDAPGYLGRAHGGTLFLDEIGDLAPLMQVKLLRLLQEHTYERVGESTPRTADVRIITATNQDLWTLVREDKMREDFYYRISVFPLLIPPLVERRSDIPLLAEFFLRRTSRRIDKKITGVTQSVMDTFMHHPWAGNVRELENVLEYSCVVAADGVIRVTDLPPHFHDRKTQRPSARPPNTPDHLREVLERAGWNRTQAARDLGISRVTLWKRMKSAGIVAPKPGQKNN